MCPMKFMCSGGMFIFPFIMFIVFIGLVIFMIKKYGNISNALNSILLKKNKENEISNSNNNSLVILKERYAKGEITKEQFEEMKVDIQ